MSTKEQFFALIGKKVKGITLSNFDGCDASGLVLTFEDGTTLQAEENYVGGCEGGWARFAIRVGTET